MLGSRLKYRFVAGTRQWITKAKRIHHHPPSDPFPADVTFSACPSGEVECLYVSLVEWTPHDMSLEAGREGRRIGMNLLRLPTTVVCVDEQMFREWLTLSYTQWTTGHTRERTVLEFLVTRHQSPDEKWRTPAGVPLDGAVLLWVDMGLKCLGNGKFNDETFCQ